MNDFPLLWAFTIVPLQRDDLRCHDGKGSDCYMYVYEQFKFIVMNSQKRVAAGGGVHFFP